MGLTTLKCTQFDVMIKKLHTLPTRGSSSLISSSQSPLNIGKQEYQSELNIGKQVYKSPLNILKQEYQSPINIGKQEYQSGFSTEI